MAQANDKTPEKEPEQLALFDGGPNMAKLRVAADKLTTATRSPRTLKEYEADWRDFAGWAKATGRATLPATADTIRLYITDQLTDHKVSTARRRIAAIRHMHKLNKHAVPDLSATHNVLAGARRDKRHKPTEKVALTVDQVKAMVEAMPRTRIGIRDSAVLLLGIASGMRRSEISALNVEDLTIHPEGVAVSIHRSKTDQEHKGRIVGVFKGRSAKSCPVKALAKWIKTLERDTGPLFVGLSLKQTSGLDRLSGGAISILLKKAVESIGLNPALYAGHSLRAGHVTAAVEAGTPELMIMQRTGHRSVQMLYRYFRPGSVWKVNPLAQGL